MRVVWNNARIELAKLADNSVPLIYIDPPFNTGKKQRLQRTRDYGIPVGDEFVYDDALVDYPIWLNAHLVEAHRVLSPNGTMYLHLDYHEVHYAKVAMDFIFGRQNFLNEIIWAYDYGGRTKQRWPCKHDNILMYAKSAKDYVFNYAAIDRIPYMAPGLQRDPVRAAEGKTPTDTWWMTIVPTNGAERTGYPTQKPRGLLDRMLLASSNPGDLVLDFFAGSGTTGASAYNNGREFLLVDENRDAITVMKKRFRSIEGVTYEPDDTLTQPTVSTGPVYTANETEAL